MSDDWDDDVFTCQECGDEIDGEQYARTGTDEFCENCPELECGDPRSHSFRNCDCFEEAASG